MKTINADKQLVKDASSVVAMYLADKIDPISKQKVSVETYEAAKKVVGIFSTIVAEKSLRIAMNRQPKVSYGRVPIIDNTRVFIPIFRRQTVR